MATVCAFFKTDFCKFRDNCTNGHIQDTCILEGCNGNCNNRHPHICRYFSLYGKCKFNDKCAYLHKRPHDSEIENLRRELSAVKGEVAMLMNKIEALQKKTTEIDESQSSDYATNAYQNMSTSSVIPQVDGNLTIQEDDTTLPPLSLECEICDLKFHDIDFYDEHYAYSHCCTICGICFRTEQDGYSHEE